MGNAKQFDILKLNQFLLFVALCCMQSSLSYAGERYEFYRGIRQMSMGGASIAVVNDETALLLNPAGLGKLREYFFTVADPEAEVNTNTKSIAASNALNAFDPQDVLNMLNAGHQDEYYHAKLQAFPSFVATNFGMGVLAKYQIDAKVTLATNEYELDYYNDVALVLGFNFRLWEGRIKLGVNTRIINRIEILRDDIPSNSTNLTVGTLASEGIGVATDAGLILTAPWVWLPTISGVVRDIGNTTYGLKDGLFTSAIVDPTKTTQTVDAAIAFFPITDKRSRMSFTAEYRDVLTAGDEFDQMRRVHAGWEYNFGDTFFIRAGMNQRYWTAGLELAVFNYQLQVASYGEDIGDATATTVTNIEDRRYLVKFALRF